MTDKILIDRSVLEQALEAMESGITGTAYDRKTRALRAALEQPDHSEQTLDMVPEGWKLVPVEPTQVEQEPVAWAEGEAVWTDYIFPTGVNTPLYTHPQPRQPPVVEQPEVEQKPFAVLVRKHSWHLDTWEVGPHGNLDYGRAWADERINVYTHPQNLNCKSTQHRLATLWGYEKKQPLTEDQEFVEFHEWWSMHSSLTRLQAWLLWKEQK